MSGQERETRTEVSIDDSSVFVAHDEDVDALKRRFEDAARNGPRFVAFRTAGGRRLDVLVTSQTRIVVTVHPRSSTDIAEAMASDLTDWDL